MIYFINPNMFLDKIKKYSVNIQKNLIDLAINPLDNYQIIGLKKIIIFSNLKKIIDIEYIDLVNLLNLKWDNMSGGKKGFYSEYLAKLLFEYDGYINTINKN